MADYPREIELDEDTEARLAAYIDDELTRHMAERTDYVGQLKRWQEDYWAEPSTTETTFPFKGGATLIIPLAAITVEAIHSRIMTTMFALDQFVSAKPTGPKYTDWSRPVERFLDAELMNGVKIKKPLNDATLEIVKYGTGVVKTGFEKITKTAIRTIGDKEQEFPVTVKNGATVNAVPVSRFLMPYAYQDPQEANWCGEQHTYTPYQVRQHETAGLFKKGTLEKLTAHFNAGNTESDQSGSSFAHNQSELENRQPMMPNQIETVELWLSFDVEGNEKLAAGGILPAEEFSNGYEKEVVVHYHQPSRTFLSIRYNWNEDLRRPYRTGVFFPVEHRWPGIGTCKQVEQFQQEITTQHRQRIDNATLANCRMIKVSNLSKYGPDEPVFPGKIWFVDNKDDIETFQLGEIYSSSYSNESQSLMYVQQRTGINEVTLGMPQAGTPGTATSDLARIQEGNKKFDFTYGNIKQLGNEVIKDTVLNIKQFGPRASIYYERVEGGEFVKQFFSSDFEEIRQGLILDIGLTSQQDNKLLDRNNWQQVAQLTTQYYENMIQLAGQDQAQLQNILKTGRYAATEIIRQILQSFDIKNVDRIIVAEALTDGTEPTEPGPATDGRSAGTMPPEGMVLPPSMPPQAPSSGIPPV